MKEGNPSLLERMLKGTARSLVVGMLALPLVEPLFDTGKATVKIRWGGYVAFGPAEDVRRASNWLVEQTGISIPYDKQPHSKYKK